MIQNAEISENQTLEQTHMNRFTASCFEWMEAIISSLIVIFILFIFLFRVITVNGSSMLPNLQNDNKILVSCVDRNLSRGDIIVVDGRGTSLNERIVKRVIATAGQTVNIDFETGIVSVDGKDLDESAYIENGITKNQYELSFPQKVPAGHIFVLGDNRAVSNDSRSSEVGMIDQRYIIGKMNFIMMPFSKFGKLSNTR